MTFKMSKEKQTEMNREILIGNLLEIMQRACDQSKDLDTVLKLQDVKNNGEVIADAIALGTAVGYLTSSGSSYSNTMVKKAFDLSREESERSMNLYFANNGPTLPPEQAHDDPSTVAYAQITALKKLVTFLYSEENQ